MRRMKDSGVEWIGEIPEGWEVRRIKTVASIMAGHGFPVSLQGRRDGDLPVFKAGDISAAGDCIEESDNHINTAEAVSLGFGIIPSGSILFPKIGEAMKKNSRAMTLTACCVDNNCQAFVPGRDIHRKYMFYISKCLDMESYDNGGTIPCVNNQKLMDSFLPYPSMDNQKKIASYLDRKCAQIDSILSLQQAAIEKLKEYKLSLITEAVTKGLNPDAPTKDSGIEWIGDVPAHWGVSKIRYAVQKIGSGTTPKSSNVEYYGGDIPWIQSGDLYGKSEIRETKSNVNEMALEHFSALTVYEGRFIVIAMYGASVGNVSISEISACTNQACCAIKTNVLNDLKFMYYWLCACKRNFLTQAEGGSQPNISQTKIRNQVYLQMGIDEQRTIATYLDQKCGQIDTAIAQKQSLIARLTAYKKSLIYEVVTGKKEV